MNTFSKTHHPKRGLKPLVAAVVLSLPCLAASAAPMNDAVTTRADQNIDQQYGRDSVYALSMVAKPLSSDRIAMLEPSRGSFLQPAYDVALGGEAKGNWEDEYVVIMPLELATMEPMIEDGTDTQYNRGYYAEPDQVIIAAVDDGTATEFDRGYYAEPEQVVIAAVDDDTANQFDRGYYKDPDLVAILVIDPNDSATQQDSSAAFDAQSMSAVAE